MTRTLALLICLLATPVLAGETDLIYAPQTNNYVGGLGIGTSSPLAALDVNGAATASQIIGRGSAPTIAAGSAAGTSPTASISGSNMAGVISLTTGTSTAASATLATITDNGTLTAAPQGCSLTPRNAASALAAAMVYAAAPSTTSWAIGVGSTALTASTAYAWSYQCE